MQAAASFTEPVTGEWRVQRDGNPFARVASHSDGTGVVVSTQLVGQEGDADRIRPYRFPDVNSAETFVRDLIASFSYLGCQVAQV